MDQGLAIVGGIGLGAGLMYLLDPERGRRRRALLRDQVVSAASRIDDALDATWNDVRQRAQGLAAETSSLVTREQPNDRVLVERVRSKIGRYLSHPGAIKVGARDGRVMLSGPVLAREVDWLLDAVASVPGVTGVENRLDIHTRAGSVIANAGVIRFEPTPEGNTRVDIRFSYNPPGGMLGHLAAKLFGADAKSAMDEDLVRLKSLIEEGRTSAPDKGETARQEVTGGAVRPAL